MGQPAARRSAPARRRPDARCTSPRRSAWTCPHWARPVIPGSARLRCSMPACARACRRRVLAFDLRQSDLPLQVAWPIMVSNLAGELLGVETPARSIRCRPRRRSSIPIRPTAQGVRVTLPDGSVDRAVAGADGRVVGHVRATRPAGRIPRRGDPAHRLRSASPGGAAATPGADARPEPIGRRRAAGRHGRRAAPVRGRPVRPRGVEHRARRRRATRRRSARTPPGRTPRPARHATSSGRCSSRWRCSSCSSSGSSTSVTARGASLNGIRRCATRSPRAALHGRRGEARDEPAVQRQPRRSCSSSACCCSPSRSA